VRFCGHSTRTLFLRLPLFLWIYPSHPATRQEPPSRVIVPIILITLGFALNLWRLPKSNYAVCDFMYLKLLNDSQISAALSPPVSLQVETDIIPSFRGFMIQARSASDRNGSSFGSFTTTSAKARTLSCFGQDVSCLVKLVFLSYKFFLYCRTQWLMQTGWMFPLSQCSGVQLLIFQCLRSSFSM